MKKFPQILVGSMLMFTFIAAGCSKGDEGEPKPKIDAAKDAAVQKQGGSQAAPTQD